jgi:FkbM family methyltransferase
MQKLNIPMSAWTASGGDSVVPESGGLAFTDGTQAGPHMLRLAHRALRGAVVHLSLRARPLPGCTTQIVVTHPALGIVCRVSSAGVSTLPGIAMSLQSGREADGTLAISVSYFSTIAAAAVGTAGPAPVYPGTGRPQYVFEEIALAVSQPEALGDDQRITVLDISGEAKFAPAWRGLVPQLLPVAICAPGVDTTVLAEDIALLPGGRVVTATLYNKKGRRKLNRAASTARSSLLATDRRTLRKFADAAPFEVQEQVNVDCVRYDDLHTAGTVPAPDVLKLEAQGAEYEVLQGFGNLLAPCLAIQLRTAFYPVYKGQKLLGDVIALLDKFDFSLARLHPIAQQGQLVEAQAWFVKSPDWAAAQTPETQKRLAAIQLTAGLPS